MNAFHTERHGGRSLQAPQFPHVYPASSPTNGLLKSFSASSPCSADVKSCRSRMMRRLRSMGEIEKVDALCRQIPYCPRNPHKLATDGRQDRAPRFPPKPPRGQNQPPALDSQALYRARRPCREIGRRRRGQPARSLAGLPASHRLDASIRIRPGAQDLPTRTRRPSGVGLQRSSRVRGPLPGISPWAARSTAKQKPSAQVPFEAARGLASAIGGMLEETLQLRRALVEREAELAAGVPLVPHPQEPEHLANRLEAVLRGGAQAVGCHAAALYLLDEATSKLKLRSCWGLPLDRLTAPPRPLQGAVADLESMLGHAVVLEDTPMMRHWRAPEDFSAAACVPVSTSTTILGTLWMFSNVKRDFTAAADEHRGSRCRTPGRRSGSGDALAGGLCRGRHQEADRRGRADAAEPIAHGRAAAGPLGPGRLDRAGRALGRRFPRLVLPARRTAGRGRRPCHGRRHPGGLGGQRAESGVACPWTVLPRGPADAQAAEPDALGRFGRRPARHALLRPDRNGHRPGLCRFGRASGGAGDSRPMAGSR